MAMALRRALGAHQTLPPTMIVIIAALGLRAGAPWHKGKDEAIAKARTRTDRVLTKDTKILLQYPWAGASTMTSWNKLVARRYIFAASLAITPLGLLVMGLKRRSNPLNSG